MTAEHVGFVIASTTICATAIYSLIHPNGAILPGWANAWIVGATAGLAACFLRGFR